MKVCDDRDEVRWMQGRNPRRHGGGAQVILSPHPGGPFEIFSSYQPQQGQPGLLPSVFLCLGLVKTSLAIN